MRLGPGTVSGRVFLASATALIVALGALAVLVPVVVRGYAADADPAVSIAARLLSAVALATLVGGLAAGAVSAFVGRTLSAPIEELTERTSSRTISSAGWTLDGAPRELETLAAALRRSAADSADRSAAAEAQRDRLATLLREMGEAVLIVGPDDSVRLANPAAERLLGRHAVVGRPLAEVARDHEVLDVVTAARSEGAATFELERLEPRRSIRLSARRLPGGETLLTAQDLTSLRRLETVRRDFVANVSHELRTPIASLKAMTEALGSGALAEPDVARDFVRRMGGELDDLAHLVEELLTLARVESGADELHPDEIAPAEILRGVAERLGPLAARAGLELSVDPAPSLPRIRGDRERIAQVLSNLVHNSVKFTPAGGRIVLSAVAEDGATRFTVSDTGIGIALDEIDRIFERFYKGERSRTGEGTGLGLAIARHVVEAHGGRIQALSEGPGRGAAFSFTIPVA